MIELEEWTWPIFIPTTDTGTIPPDFRLVQWQENGTAIRLTPLALDAAGSGNDDDQERDAAQVKLVR